MPLTRPALERIAQALGPDAADGLETGHTLLCRREAGAFQKAAKSGEELLVACTQESRLFLDLAAPCHFRFFLTNLPMRHKPMQPFWQLRTVLQEVFWAITNCLKTAIWW